GHGLGQMIALTLELHGVCLLVWVRGENRVSVCAIPDTAGVVLRPGVPVLMHTGPTWCRSFLIERTVIVIGTVDSGENPSSRRSAAVFCAQGVCLVRGRRGLSCGSRPVPRGLATGCPPVIRNSSTMLSTN